MKTVRHTTTIAALCTLAACDSGQEAERARAAADKFWADTKAGDAASRLASWNARQYW